MMWLRRAMGLQDMEAQPAPDPTMTNPVGWSSIYPPQRMSNPDPSFSELARKDFMTPQQRMGAMLMAKDGPVTNAQLPAATDKANAFMDIAMTVAGATSPVKGGWNPSHVADELAKTLKEEGFRVSMDRGNGPVGPSSYMSVFDPTTRRYLQKEVRVSDHSTGAARFKDYLHVLGPDDVQSVIDAAKAMRARGGFSVTPNTPSEAAIMSARAEQIAEQITAASRKAYPEEWAAIEGKTGAAAAKVRSALRKKYSAEFGGGE